MRNHTFKTFPHQFQTQASESQVKSWLISLVTIHHHHHHNHHLSLNREGRWGTTDDFATSFLHFPCSPLPSGTLANSRHVHSLMLFSHLFLCLPYLLPPFTVPCKMALARPADERISTPRPNSEGSLYCLFLRGTERTITHL